MPPVFSAQSLAATLSLDVFEKLLEQVVNQGYRKAGIFVVTFVLTPHGPVIRNFGSGFYYPDAFAYLLSSKIDLCEAIVSCLRGEFEIDCTLENFPVETASNASEMIAIPKHVRNWPKLGILGSTRGTDLQFLIDAIEDGWLPASIEIVVSNRRSAYILQRAKMHGLQTSFQSAKDCKSRDEFDAKVSDTLMKRGVDLVLLIGYMRILSDSFVETWSKRCLNVHPSLLPDFAGGMDVDVHQAVIDSGKSESGCTVHLVTGVVDGGPIVTQYRCPVFPNEDPLNLKTRVQKLEGPAFVESILKYMNDDPVFR